MFSGWALRNVLDNSLRAGKPGLKVYLRTSNETIEDLDTAPGEDDEFATYGFQICVTGAAVTGGEIIPGYTDQLIQPPPDVEALTLHDIGLNSGKLFFGAHSFLISHTWVKNRMNVMGITDPYQIFRADNVIGLIYNGRVFSLEDVRATSAHGEVISWFIVGNMLESTQTESECC